MVAAMARFGLDENADAPPVSPRSSRPEQLAYLAEAEHGFEAVYASLYDELAPIDNVAAEVLTIDGPDGNEIRLHVHRRKDSTSRAPCVVQIHGGGMTIMATGGASYTRLRDELAATGLVVVGIEFRNAAGIFGAHPYPAGLSDCAVGLRWTAEHLDELGASHMVVTGDSGGANLALAATILAKREGWIDTISGVYAQCPFIYGFWADRPDELPSIRASNGYFLNVNMLQVMSEAYDPGGVHATEPTCWPYRASIDDLKDLPPHVISVNELDPMLDEGLVYYRKLLKAGVDATGRTNLGLCHTGETMFRVAMPGIYAANIQAISDFARSVG
jgi:acetyl esterase/lipase